MIKQTIKLDEAATKDIVEALQNGDYYVADWEITNTLWNKNHKARLITKNGYSVTIEREGSVRPSK